MARIVIADDEAYCRNIIAKHLTRRGYEVATASTGMELVSLLEVVSADLVITDLNMPQMNGIEALQIIRHRLPGLPWIAISGGSRAANGPQLEHAEDLGAACVLAKPFPMADLMAAVAAIVGTAPAPR